MSISERMRLIRSKLELSQSDVASKFNIPLGSWKKYEAGPSEPGAGALRELALGGINTNWLLTGEGDMWLESLNIREQVPGYKPIFHKHEITQLEESTALSDDFVLIPMYRMESSGENGSAMYEEVEAGQLAFRKDWIKSKGLQKEKLATLKARGDSMETTLHDGDLLLIDTRIESIIDDSIYIIQNEQHLVVKRLQQSLDGSVSIISDNQRYKEQYLNPEQAKSLKIAGRVCWYGHEI